MVSDKLSNVRVDPSLLDQVERYAPLPLWTELVQQLPDLAPDSSARNAGCPRVSARNVIAAYRWLLHQNLQTAKAASTGGRIIRKRVSLNDLPATVFGCTGMTVRRRLDEWRMINRINKIMSILQRYPLPE